MKIDSVMTPYGESIFYTDDFRVVLESHLTYLRLLSTTKYLTVSEHQAYKYEGDLFGLLDDLVVPKQYHYIIMALNGLNSPNELTATTTYLFIPDVKEVNLIKNIHMSKKTNF